MRASGAVGLAALTNFQGSPWAWCLRLGGTSVLAALIQRPQDPALPSHSSFLSRLKVPTVASLSQVKPPPPSAQPKQLQCAHSRTNPSSPEAGTHPANPPSRPPEQQPTQQQCPAYSIRSRELSLTALPVAIARLMLKVRSVASPATSWHDRSSTRRPKVALIAQGAGS